MPRLRIGLAADIPPGEARFFCVDGYSVLIAHLADAFYALDGMCPHKGFELDHARLIEDVVECPWHRYQYDVRTGENCFPSRIYLGDIAQPADAIATYPVEIAGGQIWVDLP
jgi:3-phenylpropionate/trans-cinnamate dioxygenase ferredoxin subunit